MQQCLPVNYRHFYYQSYDLNKNLRIKTNYLKRGIDRQVRLTSCAEDNLETNAFI